MDDLGFRIGDFKNHNSKSDRLPARDEPDKFSIHPCQKVNTGGRIKAFVFWDQQYSVDNAEIDEQHQKLFKMINLLGDEIAAGKGSEAVTVTLDEMTQYLLFHFTSEEQIMREHSYPDIDAHIDEHQAFYERTKFFLEQHQAGDPDVAKKVWQFLADWLVKHILGADMKYVPFLKGETA